MPPRLLITASVLIASALSALIAGAVAYSVSHRLAMSRLSTASIRTHALHIIDEQGKVRMTLSASGAGPTVQLLDIAGQKRITMSVDQHGYGIVHLSNPNPAAPVASLEIDDKGAHVKFDRPGGASSYLYLNNSGGSGIVLIDSAGTRRLDLMVVPSGETEFRRYDQSSQKTQDAK